VRDKLMHPKTQGAHHIGLTVSKLEASADFFIHILGWHEVRRDLDYPAIFVTDGLLMVTLWQTQKNHPRPFDRKTNVGLHHLALSVDSFDKLDALHDTISAEGFMIEFPPQPLRSGPAKHMMCDDPSGLRVEFICVPKPQT